MKQLILVRHAKSNRANGGRDFDRPLNVRGERDAPEMAVRLAVRGIRPQLIVASGARRALTTAQKMAAAFDYPLADIDIVDALYEASEQTWIAQIRALPAHRATVLMVGHNPEITAVVNRLCPLARIGSMPTCGVLLMEYAPAVDAWPDVPRSVPVRWRFSSRKNSASRSRNVSR